MKILALFEFIFIIGTIIFIASKTKKRSVMWLTVIIGVIVMLLAMSGHFFFFFI